MCIRDSPATPVSSVIGLTVSAVPQPTNGPPESLTGAVALQRRTRCTESKEGPNSFGPVSYTHLDVYKRQVQTTSGIDWLRWIISTIIAAVGIVIYGKVTSKA